MDPDDVVNDDNVDDDDDDDERGDDDDDDDDERGDDDADEFVGVDDVPLVLDGEERNLSWYWDKVRSTSSSGLGMLKCQEALVKFHNILSDCICEARDSDNGRKYDLLLGYERDARACVSSLLSGKGGILLEGSHFSRVSNIPLPATVSGARNARRPERFRGRQDEDD